LVFFIKGIRQKKRSLECQDSQIKGSTDSIELGS
jgi:hypothetical protein